MALVSRSSSTWVLSLKILFISIGVLSMAVILKLSVPVIAGFAVNEVPVMWKCFVSWLRPPYLYVIINGIIITIVASSRFQHRANEQPEAVEPASVSTDPPTEIPPFAVMEPTAESVQGEVVVSEVNTVMNGSEVVDEYDSVISRSTWTPPARSDSTEMPTEYPLPTEKPLVSARFCHRKPVKASPEGGKALRVAKPKRHETLENTWKTITEGRPMPLTRHLKKTDTWEQQGRLSRAGEEDPTPEKVKKSETFKDRTNNLPPNVTSSPSSGRLRKEPSLSQEELNRRVEAFIKKFNEEMRLQRQESLNQYMEMINRGAH